MWKEKQRRERNMAPALPTTRTEPLALGFSVQGQLQSFTLPATSLFSFWVFGHFLHNELPRRKHLKFNSGREGSTGE